MTFVGAISVVAIVLASSLTVTRAHDEATPDGSVSVQLPGDGGKALLWPGGDRAVLLVHGAVYDAASWTEQADVLQDERYTVLAVEEIAGPTITTALRWLLEERKVSSVVVIGASAGGGGAVRALSAQPDGVAGLVLMGTTGSVDGLGDYPKLFIASEGEGMRDRLEGMADEAAGDRNRVEIIPGDAHAQATFREPEGEQLLDLILRFLEDDAAWTDIGSTPVG
jgi:pimeloyl-ACP methyl ester carboxylesterase